MSMSFWHWLFPRKRWVFMVPISDTEYVPGDTVWKLIAAGQPFYVGNAPSRWERHW